MGEPIRTRKEKLAEEFSTMHDWVVWCKSKKGLEEIRSFELSGNLFYKYDETKSKEEKNKKNWSQKKAHRGQSV